MSATLAQLVSDNKMVLFVQGGCPYCSMAAQALDGAGIEYLKHELSNEEVRSQTFFLSPRHPALACHFPSFRGPKPFASCLLT